MLNLAACYTYQVVATSSPAQLIETTQLDRVHVTTQDGTQVELENSPVEGDELVSHVRDQSMAANIGIKALVVLGLAVVLLIALVNAPMRMNLGRNRVNHMTRPRWANVMLV